jgi:hypothetical protein
LDMVKYAHSKKIFTITSIYCQRSQKYLKFIVFTP